jgi:hypothetical protein
MNPTLRLRNLTRADLPFADQVRALAGWNQTPADWERMLDLEPDGCFLAEWHGNPAGTATTTVGRALLERCLAYLSGRGVRVIKLDATPEGRAVYRGLGFQDEWTLTRWQSPGGSWPAGELDPHIRAWRPGDLGALDDLDTAVFGVWRLNLLKKLAEQSQRALIWESDEGPIQGYGFSRNGSHARYLGPVVAMNEEVALALVRRLIGDDTRGRIIWDMPDQNLTATAWARQHGFNPQRSLTRMRLGENTMPGDPQKQFAIAGPELG